MNFEKTPREVLDYGLDWTSWLDGDTIAASEWSVPIDLEAGESNFSGTETVIWLSGGLGGRDYTVTNRITTTAGRTKERVLLIQVKESL